MQPHRPLRALRISKPVALLLAFLASACALSYIGFVPSVAQSPQKEEREIEDTTPKHLPIKLKVRNEEKVKGLDNESWARYFELEVKNTSARPIYYISLGLGMPEVKAPDGTVIGFHFRYGRINMADYTARPTPDDIPLLPGETHVFTIPERNLKDWEILKAEYPNPSKLRITIHYLNFGDGTGFFGPDGTPLPTPRP